MTTVPAKINRDQPSSILAKVKRSVTFLQRGGILITLILLLFFGAYRYDNFLTVFNISSVLRYNSMIGLIALGMTFVIMTGGIDLSVGAIAAFSSVIAALMSQHGLAAALFVPLLLGLVLGFINGFVITKMNILPFITTLAMLLAARGLALMYGNNASVPISYEGYFIQVGQGDYLGVPIPVLILAFCFIVGIIVLKYTQFGRDVLAVGGNEEAARLLGIPVVRTKIIVYMISGLMASLAGVILAAQFGAGQPTEGVGWELSAIASVVIGGTLLTGGMGSIWASVVGALLLGLVFNILNFENGRGLISLSSYAQSVIRGGFLLVVVLLQNRTGKLLGNKGKS